MSKLFRYLIFFLILIAFSSTAGADADSPNESVIRVGALFSLSGFGALYGESELNGVRLAVEHINASGGVYGKRLELVVEDNRSDNKATQSAFERLATVEKVPVIIGPNWIEFSEVAAPLAESRKVVMITPSGWSKSLTKGRSFVFSTLPPHEQYVDLIVKNLQEKGIKSVTVVVAESSFLLSLHEEISALLADAHVNVVKTISVTPGSADFRLFVTQLKALGSEGTILILLPDGSHRTFLREARALRLPGPFFASIGLTQEEPLLKELPLADGVIINDVDFLVHDSGDFLKRLRYRFPNTALPGIAARAYDTVYLLKAALMGCGGDTERLNTCLSKASYDGVSGRLKFDAQNTTAPDPALSSLKIVRGNKFAPIPSLRSSSQQ